jgi:hypothetical protein
MVVSKLQSEEHQSGTSASKSTRDCVGSNDRLSLSQKMQLTQCPDHFPELGNVDRLIKNGLFPGKISKSAVYVACSSISPHKLCASISRIPFEWTASGRSVLPPRAPKPEYRSDGVSFVLE